MPMPDAMTAALQRAAAREAEAVMESQSEALLAFQRKCNALADQLAEAIARAEFAEDQCEVAVKDRDHAERRLEEAREVLPTVLEAADALDGGMALTVRWPDGAETDERVSQRMDIAIESVRAALQDRALSEQDGG